MRARASVAECAVVAAGPKFRSVWKAPDISSLNFVGKTVAALVITDSQSLQVSAEEKLVSELMGLGSHCDQISKHIVEAKALAKGHPHYQKEVTFYEDWHKKTKAKTQ